MISPPRLLAMHNPSTFTLSPLTLSPCHSSPKLARLMSFQCDLVTPEQQAFSQTVTQVILPAHDGLVGILTDRAPLLVKLGQGPLRIDVTASEKRYFYIEGGIAQMKDNKLTILTQEATPADAIDAEAARAEYAEATARKPTDEKSAKDRDRQLQGARVKQQMARK
jgi:F-type H+-transporting ATPase subunit epsilon